ncbi:cytochrome P450 [Thozetella sp. PMI_491]|nr:cytochrome P450 [Thozetella sp. PMI_491]
MHLLFVAAVLLGLVAARFLYIRLSSPLRSIPGPFAARLSRLWYFDRVRNGRFEKDNIALHCKYGPVVRVAPNFYSIDDPAVVKTVYGHSSRFRKADWYYGWQHPSPERWTLFSDRDIRRHAEARRRFQALYSMSSIVTYEKFVDECGDLFLEKLRGLATEGPRYIDLGHWFQCYAFDVVACLTYGRRLGFLDQGNDDGVFHMLDQLGTYSTLVGIYPDIYRLLFHVTSKLPNSGAKGRLFVQDFVAKHVALRQKERAAGEKPLRGVEGGKNIDFLDRLLAQHEEDPEKVTKYHVMMMGTSNIIAGSDTTAVSLDAVLYHLLKNPRVLAKLREELSDRASRGQLSERVTFKESQELPYFQAVMKEALRMHPATGLPLWRVVPDGGTEISGHFFPAGTVVGLNSWTAHYNQDVFGPDAGEFRPERWLEAELEAERGNKDRLQEMEAYYLPFGLGSRTCVGRHISFLEMSKILPRVVRDFDFELRDPDKEWDCCNRWFVKPVGFFVRIRPRGSLAS